MRSFVFIALLVLIAALAVPGVGCLVHWAHNAFPREENGEIALTGVYVTLQNDDGSEEYVVLYDEYFGIAGSLLLSGALALTCLAVRVRRGGRTDQKTNAEQRPEPLG